MISKVVRDFHFGRNRPLKSADDRYIGISKNKIIKLKKNKKTGHSDWVTEHAVICVCI
jgi:hypothetical protein